MTVALTQAFQRKEVIVKKFVTGEVIIKFPPELKIENILINNNNDVVLTNRKNVDIKALKKSNLKRLLEINMLGLVFND